MKPLDALRFSVDSLEVFDVEPDGDGKACSRAVRSSLLADAVRISPQLFPALARSIDFAIERLDPSIEIEAWVTADPQPNARCVPLNDAFHAAVVLSSGLAELLSEAELCFVVGHELGHYLFDHGVHPQPSPDMGELQQLRVLALRRAAEISADRVGFVCAPTPDDAFRGMLKVASGLSDRHLRLDLGSYLAQLRELTGLSGHHDAIYASHPMFPVRARALLWFSMSEPYYRFTGRSERAPIDAETLDARVEGDLAAASGFGLDHIESQALRSVKIWSLMRLASLDHRIDRDDRRRLTEWLGADEAEKAIRFVAGQGREAPRVIEQKLAAALEGSQEVPQKLRDELFEELEHAGPLLGANPGDCARALAEIAAGLGLDRAGSGAAGVA